MTQIDFVELYEARVGDYRTCRLCRSRVHADWVHWHVERHHDGAIRSGAAVRIGRTGGTWRVLRSAVLLDVRAIRDARAKR